MSSYIGSPQVAFASGPWPSGSAESPFSRMALFILVAAVGISIGTAAGIVIGVLTTPSVAPAEPSNFVQASSTTAQAEIRPAVNANPVQAAQPAPAPLAAAAGQQNADTGQSASKVTDLSLSAANPAINAQVTSAAQAAQIKAPTTLKAENHKVAGRGRRAGGLIGRRVARPARLVLASEPLDAPAALNDELLSLGDEAQPSTFYTEGDLTVTDYDAKTGTIETSDGRTFTLGMTVGASNATSWEDYRSDVHYRCGQNGGCALTRAGVVAPNARLI